MGALRRVVPEMMTTEWRVTWTEDMSHRPPYWPAHTQVRTETFGEEGHARRWARHLSSRGEIHEIRVDTRRVTPWTLTTFTPLDESKPVDGPSWIV